MRAFFIGLQFLTRISIVEQKDWCEKDFADSVRYFPLIGLVLGIIYTAFAALLLSFLPKNGILLPHHVVAAILLILPIATALWTRWTDCFRDALASACWKS